MSNSSFQYFEHWKRVAEIAGLDQRDIRHNLLTRDTTVVFPNLGQDIMDITIPANQAFVMTRFEAFAYDTSQAFPVQDVFDNGTVFTWGLGTAAGALKTGLFSNLANAISNIDLVAVFSGGDKNSVRAMLQIIAVSGPKNVNIVTTAYLWQIPAAKVANFQPYLTIFA